MNEIRTLQEERIEAFEGAQRAPAVAVSVYLLGALVGLGVWHPWMQPLLRVDPWWASISVGCFLAMATAANVSFHLWGWRSRAFQRFEYLETLSLLGMLFACVYSSRGAPLYWFFLLAFVGASAGSPASGAGALRLVPLGGALSALALWLVADDGAAAVETVLFSAAASFLGYLMFGQQSRLARALDERDSLRQELGALLVEEERGRIARELHDGVAGDLTALTARLELLRSDVATRGPELDALHRDLETLRERSVRGMDDLRSIVWALRSPEGSLEETLAYSEARCGELCTHQEITFERANQQAKLDGALRLHVLRVLQEAVHNAIRHGDAARIFVRALVEADTLVLSIRDDGRGPGAARPSSVGGLANIERRATAYGGGMTLEAGSNGHGSVLTVRFRLKAAAIAGNV